MNLVFMGKNAAQWLMKDVEHIVVGVNPKQFFTFRGGGGYCIHSSISSNSFGAFLLLNELKICGSRRSVIIPKGRGKHSWRILICYGRISPFKIYCSAT